MNRKELINNKGSVEDVRTSLYYINPQTEKAARKDIQYLKDSVKDEQNFRNRISVIALIERRINVIRKQFNIE